MRTTETQAEHLLKMAKASPAHDELMAYVSRQVECLHKLLGEVKEASQPPTMRE